MVMGARWKAAAGALGLAVLAGATGIVAANLATSAEPAQPTAQLPTSTPSDGEPTSGSTPTQAPMAELPGGGYTIFDNKVYVALYGHPTISVLGSLGEQSTRKTVRRVTELASTYRPHTKRQVVPAFEVITTIASERAGADGDYSDETPIEELEPTIRAARRNGIYVILDLQPGRTDFLTQAKRYRKLLLEPHVGLALDPEWRLKPWQVHLRQLGEVNAAEVNAVSDWLAKLTRKNNLPQKMLLLHQFRNSMIVNRAQLDTSHEEVAPVIQMDGFGPESHKFEAWEAVRKDSPEGIVWGWKNFIDEDSPMFTPKQTMKVRPQPRWVSFQ
jgi:hypothetical protein